MVNVSAFFGVVVIVVIMCLMTRYFQWSSYIPYEPCRKIALYACAMVVVVGELDLPELNQCATYHY